MYINNQNIGNRALVCSQCRNGSVKLMPFSKDGSLVCFSCGTKDLESETEAVRQAAMFIGYDKTEEEIQSVAIRLRADRMAYRKAGGDISREHW